MFEVSCAVLGLFVTIGFHIAGKTVHRSAYYLLYSNVHLCNLYLLLHYKDDEEMMVFANR